MIANPHKAYLLKERASTLKLMQHMAWKYKESDTKERRKEIEDCLKILGQMSLEYSKEIEETERNGMTPNQKRWYATQAKFDRELEAFNKQTNGTTNQQPHTQAHGQVRTPERR